MGSSSSPEPECCCPICIEPFSESCSSSWLPYYSPSSSPAVELACCSENENKQKICHSCLYRHITSVIEEGATGGRRSIACPFGCGKDVSDLQVRQCFHRQHYSFFWEGIGRLLYCLIVSWLQFCCCYPPSRYLASLHRFWWYFRHTRAERADLLRYENWSKAVAFAELAKKHGGEQVVLHCPAPNCDYAWMVADPKHRSAKQRNESRPYFLWYSPPRFEAERANWAEADYLNVDFDGFGGSSANQKTIPEDTEDPATYQKDGRRMACGKCGFVFCGLCRNPWQFGNSRHHGIACSRFARKIPNNLDASDVYASRSTRACPGCRMRTIRIDGCNHMSCPCGMEWCYVCGVKWHPVHYGCSDGRGDGGCSIL